MNDGPIQRYEGAPREPGSPGEKGRWQKFLEWIFPMLRYKYAQAERMLEARVHKEEGEALEAIGRGREAIASARVAEERARHIVQLSAELERGMLMPGSSGPMSEADLVRRWEEIRDGMDRLSALHGTEFGFNTSIDSGAGNEENPD